jgi:hypothetical protein
MGYFGVKGARERCCRLGWLRRCEPGANEDERESVTGDCEDHELVRSWHMW